MPPARKSLPERAWEHLNDLHRQGVPDDAIADSAGCSASMLRSVRIGYRSPSPELARRLLAVRASSIAARVPLRQGLADATPIHNEVIVPLSADAREAIAELEAEPLTRYPRVKVGDCRTCGGPLRRVDVPHWLSDSETVARCGGWCDTCRFGWIVTTTTLPYATYRGDAVGAPRVVYTPFRGDHVARLMGEGIVR